ncbi:MAG TPA: hypothetical protein QGH10_25505, partial [Armatimonadota bacterium]|nr:hypothetical protein [Armatimonadota bacterium]
MADAQRATTHDLGRWTSLRLPGRLLITTTVLLLLMICYFREWLTTYTSPLLLGSYLVVGLTLPLAIHHALVVRFWVMRRSDVKALIVPIVGYALFIFVVLIERAHQSIGDAHMSVGVIGLLMLLPIWAWFGFLAARSTQNAYWLGTILSAIIAAAAFASYVMRQTGIAYEPIITPARWPMRLVFLFAYLWHLSAWLGGKRKGRHASIIAVLACVPELMLTMHKPVLLATMVGTSIVVLPHLASRRILLRLVPAIGLSVVALIVLNWASGNAIAARAQNAIVRSWLHVDAGMASE